jgi:hypothetical protein
MPPPWGVGEIVNLRRELKRRQRAAAAAEAAENRVRHGRTGTEKAADRLATERTRRAQDGARLDHEPEER